jgi:hypothetical protein
MEVDPKILMRFDVNLVRAKQDKEGRDHLVPVRVLPRVQESDNGSERTHLLAV